MEGPATYGVARGQATLRPVRCRTKVEFSSRTEEMRADVGRRLLPTKSDRVPVARSLDAAYMRRLKVSGQ